MATITFPLLTVVDDSGAVTSGATVTITSVADKAGSAISSPGATVNQSGANVSVDYDPELKGEAWIVLAISKVSSTFTGLNAAPAFYLARDSSRVLTALPTAAPNAANGLPTFGTGAGQINPASGKVPATIAPGDYSGNTAQTGDSFARLGAPAGASIAADVQTRAASTQIPANFTTATFASAGVFATAALANAPTGGSAPTAAQIRTEMDSNSTRLANLDAAISTRSTYAGGAVASVTGAVGSVTSPVSINLGQTGLSPRDLGPVADASLTVGDALVSAISEAAGKEAVVGTAYTKKTPSTGTTIRTFTLDSGTAPTSRS